MSIVSIIAKILRKKDRVFHLWFTQDGVEGIVLPAVVHAKDMEDLMGLFQGAEVLERDEGHAVLRLNRDVTVTVFAK